MAEVSVSSIMAWSLHFFMGPVTYTHWMDLQCVEINVTCLLTFALYNTVQAASEMSRVSTTHKCKVYCMKCLLANYLGVKGDSSLCIVMLNCWNAHERVECMGWKSGVEWNLVGDKIYV